MRALQDRSNGNALPSIPSNGYSEPSWTNGAGKDRTRLATCHSPSTAGYVSRLQSHANCRRKILQQLRHTITMPIVQHVESRKELLSQLWHRTQALVSGLHILSSGKAGRVLFAFAEALLHTDLELFPRQSVTTDVSKTVGTDIFPNFR